MEGGGKPSGGRIGWFLIFRWLRFARPDRPGPLGVTGAVWAEGISTMRELAIGMREINLTQVLKSANLAESGGQAKGMIAEGLVKVNGVVETRKRRQMAVGDVVEVEGHEQVRLVKGGGLGGAERGGTAS